MFHLNLDFATKAVNTQKCENPHTYLYRKEKQDLSNGIKLDLSSSITYIHQFHRLHTHEKNEKTATCISEFKDSKAVVQNYAPTLECAIASLTY